ncbi:MAG: ATP-binding protein [Oscillibacter sp.]|nr:ATP-binding protein [Oscillibacter sp.]
MDKIIRRPLYVNMLKNRKDNGEVKVITGSRRSGKSWLLSHLYRDWLIENGVPEQNIIYVALDLDDDSSEKDLRDPKTLKKFLYQRITDETKHYYVFLDEIQEVADFERVVNGLNAKDNVDVYVTGSNSKFLSSDIKTIFRGRGDEVRVYPLSFKEFCTNRTEPLSELWKEYYTYGGMPGLLQQKTKEQKVRYLQRLWNKTYLDDVVERNNIRNRQALESVVDVLCSAIGSLTNPSRIANSLQSVQKLKVDDEAINSYLKFLEEAFLFEGAQRFNIKGAKYYESIKKFYSVDVGLRNARLNFRQQEITHIMENVIYNELRMRGFLVDVGVVENREKKAGKMTYVQYEVDFIATNGTEKYYIQSAYMLSDMAKQEQELKSFRKIHDTFQKIVIVGSDVASYRDEWGFLYISLFDFLLNDNVLK